MAMSIKKQQRMAKKRIEILFVQPLKKKSGQYVPVGGKTIIYCRKDKLLGTSLPDSNVIEIYRVPQDEEYAFTTIKKLL